MCYKPKYPRTQGRPAIFLLTVRMPTIARKNHSGALDFIGFLTFATKTQCINWVENLIHLMRRLLLFAVLIQTLHATGQDISKWTPEDIITTEYLRSAVISPDNNMVAWVKAEANKEKDRMVSHIYLTKMDVQKENMPLTVQLTRGDESSNSPLFSADGNNLFFLSSRDKGKNLWALNLHGGEAEEIHEFENGISSIDWLNDSCLILKSYDGPSLLQLEQKEKKDDVLVIEDTVLWKRTKLYSFHIDTKELTRLTNNKKPIADYAVSNDGHWLIYAIRQSTHYASDANPDDQIVLHDLRTNEQSTILPDLQTPGNFQFTKSGQGFYFMSIRSSNPEWNGAGEGEVWYFDLATKSPTRVNLDAKWGTTGSIFVNGENVLVDLANGPTKSWAQYVKSGSTWIKKMFNTAHYGAHFFVSAISEDHSKIVFEHSTGSQLPKYYLSDHTAVGSGSEIVSLNKKLINKPITRHEIMRWQGWNDEEVNGILYYPENYQEGQRYPLMLSIHGGPSGVDQDRWRERWSTYPQILAQRGAFVLKPNYHGSSDHGQEFVESIKGHYYDLELADITKGIDVLDTKGMIDTSQLGVMGWSNGAILATMLTVRYPDMFKVACPGAGDVNWTSDFGTCRFGVSFDQSYFGGAPWDDVGGKVYNENYILKSPLFELEKVKTPTIIFHGSEDRAVPRDQGWEYYRALQQVGATPVRFLWFPGQPHGLGKITHQQRKMKEELAWIDRYLFEKEPQEDPSLKDDSPLALLLKKEKEGMHAGLLGQNAHGTLIPNLVEIKPDSLWAGQYEVTNGQFLAFQSDFSFPPGEENHPAVVDHDQAVSYCTWLSNLSGDTYRMPNSKEGSSWHKKATKAAAKENTLNYWAGYDINPQDAQSLQNKMKSVHSTLTKPGGQFKPMTIGAAKIFDLAGNVAEYCEDGSTYGYSALDFVDPANTSASASKELVGFRVIKER